MRRILFYQKYCIILWTHRNHLYKCRPVEKKLQWRTKDYDGSWWLWWLVLMHWWKYFCRNNIFSAKKKVDENILTGCGRSKYMYMILLLLYVDIGTDFDVRSMVYDSFRYFFTTFWFSIPCFIVFVTIATFGWVQLDIFLTRTFYAFMFWFINHVSIDFCLIWKFIIYLFI